MTTSAESFMSERKFCCHTCKFFSGITSCNNTLSLLKRGGLGGVPGRHPNQIGAPQLCILRPSFSGVTISLVQIMGKIAVLKGDIKCTN